MRNIEPDEFICEYVGEVKLASTCKEATYVANIFNATTVTLDGLVIDATKKGNESRFINSITKDTPKEIQKNTTMVTLWCRQQLRVLVVATKPIPKYNPIVMDYNEYANTYFEDEDAETVEEEGPRIWIPKQEQIGHNLRLKAVNINPKISQELYEEQKRKQQQVPPKENHIPVEVAKVKIEEVERASIDPGVRTEEPQAERAGFYSLKVERVEDPTPLREEIVAPKSDKRARGDVPKSRRTKNDDAPQVNEAEIDAPQVNGMRAHRPRKAKIDSSNVPSGVKTDAPRARRARNDAPDGAKYAAPTTRTDVPRARRTRNDTPKAKKAKIDTKGVKSDAPKNPGVKIEAPEEVQRTNFDFFQEVEIVKFDAFREALTQNFFEEKEEDLTEINLNEPPPSWLS
eukprot:TRINITY_DN5238_c0_g1_i3.p1 TRINITY_DN5238_c0_g1~~TRINITY_DN5238_c0_g1_i3.p1  ORF type:complete len:401 (-),score=68.47 TRINITY_DN5238_c0_g1_i3:1-1203(-)